LYFFRDFFEIFSILEVKIGRNRPGILGVKEGDPCSGLKNVMVEGGRRRIDTLQCLVFSP
jgi:hypothetical protein